MHLQWSHRFQPQPMPRMMDSDAPKAALDDTPSVYGVAKGFLIMVCTIHPPIARIAPTNAAISTRGAYTRRTICSVL